MQVQPELSVFAATHSRGSPQVVWTTLVADLETPVSAMLKLADGRPNSFLLESVEGGAIRGRYSFIGLKPDLIWRCFGDRAEINRQARFDANAFLPCPVSERMGTLASLRAVIAESRIDLPPGLPPMAAGLVGYLGYDMVRLMENLPDENPDVLGLPDGLFLRPTVIAVFDNIADTVTVITPVWPDDRVTAEAAYDQSRKRLADIVTDFGRSLPYQRTVTAQHRAASADRRRPCPGAWCIGCPRVNIACYATPCS